MNKNMLLPKQFTEDSYITYFIYTLNIQVSHAGSILHWCSPFFDCNTTQFYRIWCSYLISYKYRFSSDCESLRLWQADTYLAARGAAVSSPGERPVSPLELTSGGLVFSWLFPGSGSLLLKRTSHSGQGSASLSLHPLSSSEHIAMSVYIFLFLLLVDGHWVCIWSGSISASCLWQRGDTRPVYILCLGSNNNLVYFGSLGLCQQFYI